MIRQRVYHIRHHHPGDEKGQEEDRMVHLGPEAIGELVDNDRQRDRGYQADDHEEQVVQHRVADKHDRVVQIRREDQIAEVLQPNPGAFDQAVNEPVLNPVVGRGLCNRYSLNAMMIPGMGR